MVQKEEFFMIRDLKSKGLSNVQIAEALEIDRKTVAKWLKADYLPSYQRKRNLPSKLDCFKSHILSRMQDGCFNAQVIFDEIIDLGYQGKLTILRDFMKPHRSSMATKACVRYETAPGKQAQVDWGEFKVQTEAGLIKKVHAFIMILGYSRMQYVEFTEDEKTDTLIRCHERAFQFFGGIPETILYDNMRTVVQHSHHRGENKWNHTFLQFARHSCFQPLRCRPYHPRTKGKVESGVKYLRRNFWPRVSEISSLADLNEKVKFWIDTKANTRLHKTTRCIPNEQHQLEQLQPLIPADFLVTDLVSRKVSLDSMISFESNFYSVPYHYVGQRMAVRDLKNGWIEIYDEQKKCIASHEKLTGKYQSQKKKKHFEGLDSWTQKNVATTAPTLTQKQNPKVHQRPLEVYDSLVSEVYQ